jgi:hypothetical protein
MSPLTGSLRLVSWKVDAPEERLKWKRIRNKSKQAVWPLKDHLDHYAQMIDLNLGLGVQACCRGPRLFDSPKTWDMVKQKVA